LDSLRILQSPEEEEEEEEDEDDFGGKATKGRGKEGPTYTLNAHFRRNLRAALSSHLAGPWSEAEKGSSSSSSSADEMQTPVQLESYMCAKWNGVLHFLVGAREGGFEEPAEEVQRFLRDTGMMAVPENEEEDQEGREDEEEDEEEEEDDSGVISMKIDGGKGGRWRRRRKGGKERNLRITNAGIDFLLKDVHVQVWRFVEYVISHEEASRDDILTFLFQLSYCRVGQSYPVGALTPAQQTLLQKFTSFGLIFQREENLSRFYPTAVAVNLIFGATMQHQQQQQQQQQRGASAVAGRAGPTGGVIGGGGGANMPKVSFDVFGFGL
jgi:transcription initiation factor TFIIH subunit 4